MSRLKDCANKNRIKAKSLYIVSLMSACNPMQATPEDVLKPASAVVMGSAYFQRTFTQLLNSPTAQQATDSCCKVLATFLCREGALAASNGSHAAPYLDR